MYVSWEVLPCDSKKTRRIGILTYSVMVLCDPKCHINVLTKSIYTKVLYMQKLEWAYFVYLKMSLGMKQNLSWKVWTISSPCLWHIIDILSTKSLLLPLPQRYYSYVYFIYGYVYFTFIRLLISNSFIKHNVFFFILSSVYTSF